MALFTPMITETMALLSQGALVRVTARRFMGRTRFLRELGGELERIGYSVITVRGQALYSELSFAAVRALLSPASANAPHPGTVTDELTRAFQADRRTVVLIDDDVDVDLPSLTAIAEAAERSGTLIVAAAIPYAQQCPEQRRRASIIDFGALIELPVLDYDDVSALAHEVLGGTVSALIVVRTASKSSGIAGLAAHILRTARMSGAIVLDNGRWIMAGETLWNHHLLPVVERFFEGLDQETLSTLYELSLLGGCDVDELTGTSPAALEALDARGLLTTFTGSDGQTAISVSPTILIDYFRQRPTDTLTVAVLARISTTGFSTQEGVDQAQLAAEAGTAQIDDYSLAKLMRDREGERLESARAQWRVSPDPGAVLSYLAELTRSRTNRDEVADLLESLPLENYDEDELLLLGSYASMWEDAVPAATLLLPRILLQAPELEPAFTALAMRATFNIEGLTPVVADWLEQTPADNSGIADAVAYYIRAVCGEASELKPTHRVGVPALVEPLHFVGDSLNALREGRMTQTLERALSLRDADRARFDKDMMVVRTYVAVLVLLRTGEWERARTLIASTLALGAPSRYLVFVYATLMRFSILLHSRRADRDIAASLLADLRFFGPVDGVLPGMQAEFEVLLAATIADPENPDHPSIAAIARTLAGRGAYDSAIITSLLGLTLNFTAEGVQSLTEITAQHQDHRHDALLRFCVLVLNQDAHLTELVESLGEEPDRFLMIRVLVQVRSRGIDGVPLHTGFARVADHVIELLRPEVSDQADLRVGVSDVAQDALTVRERETALLAITLSNSEISQRLGLSVRTVENHIARAMKKLGATSRSAFQSLL